MDFDVPAAIRELRDRTRRFIAEQVIPFENDARQGPHGPEEDLRRELVERARKVGLLTPHASVEMGGLGLSHVAKAVVFEEAGYSWLGPTALNIHAPDEGNIHLMEQVATAAQKERWLRPQVAGIATVSGLNGRWRAWIGASPVDTPCLCSRTCVSRLPTCWVKWDRDFVTPR